MIQMTITVYVDWSEEELISEKEKDEKIKEIADYLEEDEDAIERFLTYVNDYSIADIFRMDESDREKLMEDFRDFRLEEAKTEFADRYNEIEVDI